MSKCFSGEPEQGRAGSCCGPAPEDPCRDLLTHTCPTMGKGPPEPLSFPLHLQGQTLNNWNITVMAAAVEVSVIPDFYLFYWRSLNKSVQCTYWTVQMSAITLSHGTSKVLNEFSCLSSPISFSPQKMGVFFFWIIQLTRKITEKQTKATYCKICAFKWRVQLEFFLNRSKGARVILGSFQLKAFRGNWFSHNFLN